MIPAPAARIAHDAGLATWLGGSMFGKFAMNPAVGRIDDRGDRGKVVNAAWNAYNVVNGVAFAGIVGGWMATRPQRPSVLDHAHDALMATTLVISAATGVQGLRLARQAPGGAVPIESIGVLANADIALGLALIAVNAVQRS